MELRAINEIFEDDFDYWQEEELEDLLDERFEEWQIIESHNDSLLEIRVSLNDVDLYGVDLDSFLEYQVIGMMFLEDMGLEVNEDYQLNEMLDVLSDYIIVYSISE